MRRSSFILGAALFSLLVFSQTGTQAGHQTFAERFASDTKIGDSGIYNFDKAHSFIGFKVKHNGLIEVPGFFRDFTGAVNFDARDITKSTVEFTAKATSVDTGVAARDNHLRTKDFFEVEANPDLTFKSTKVEKKGDNWILSGDLTIRGVTKPISFPFQIAGWLPADERSGGRMGITAETTINRRDFGVNYGTNAALSDQVKVVLQIEAAKRREAPAAPKPAS
ncbi:MAG: YceI family protein [Pyrinomonadaceae bacterium]